MLEGVSKGVLSRSRRQHDAEIPRFERNISLKLTQLGLTNDRVTSVDNLRRILDAAAARQFFVRIDMEDSKYTAVTLDVFETMSQQASIPRDTSSRCCTASAAICRRRSRAMDSVCASMFHSGVNGSRTSCGVSANDPPMSVL